MYIIKILLDKELYIKWKLEEIERKSILLKKEEEKYKETLETHWTSNEHKTLHRKLLINDLTHEKKFGDYIMDEKNLNDITEKKYPDSFVCGDCEEKVL